jgi:L-amino acid N-acyltransferase YncA
MIAASFEVYPVVFAAHRNSIHFAASFGFRELGRML